MSKSECDDRECAATPKIERKKRQAVVNKRSQEADARVSVRLVSCRGPNGQSGDDDEKDEGHESN